MSLHCHNCKWEQDDFWDFSFSKHGHWCHWKYNPISVFCSYIFSKKGYWKPRYINWGKYTAKEMGLPKSKVHSWYMIWYCLKKMMKNFKKQKYWTYQSWKKAIKNNDGKRPQCPICGKNKLDLD